MLLGFASTNTQEKPSVHDHLLPSFLLPYLTPWCEEGSGMEWAFGPKDDHSGDICQLPRTYMVPSVLGL